MTSSPFSNLIKLFLETPVERAKSSRVKPRAFRCPLILSQKIAGNTLVLGSAGLSFIVKVSLRLLSASSLLTSSLRNYRSLNISYLGDTFGLTRSSDIGIENSQLNERGESFSQPERRRMSWRLIWCNALACSADLRRRSPALRVARQEARGARSIQLSHKGQLDSGYMGRGGCVT